MECLNDTYGADRDLQADLGEYVVVLWGSRREVQSEVGKLLTYHKLCADEYEYIGRRESEDLEYLKRLENSAVQPFSGESYYLIIIMILCSLSFLAGTVDEKAPKTRFPVLKN